MLLADTFYDSAIFTRFYAAGNRKSIEWRTILAQPIVTFKYRSAMGVYCEAQLFDAGMRLSATYDVEQLITVVGLIQADMALGIMSSDSAQLMAVDGLVMRHLVKPQIARPLVLAKRAGRMLTPAATLLQQTIVRHCAIGSSSSS